MDLLEIRYSNRSLHSSAIQDERCDVTSFAGDQSTVFQHRTKGWSLSETSASGLDNVQEGTSTLYSPADFG